MNAAFWKVSAIALALLIAATLGGCARVAAVTVKSARFTGLHPGGTPVTWQASEADVLRFSDAYANAKRLSDDNGTTAPARIDAVLESGESMVVLGGSEGFQTVSLGGQQFNVDGQELGGLLKEIAARPEP
jgi:hypothetical protein